jgi:predicted transcriptional regulator
MKPIHLIYPVILFALGTWGLSRPGWEWFGIALWILGGIATSWIVMADLIERRARYNDTITDMLNAASKNDLDKLAALGLKSTDVKESVNVNITEGTRSRHFDLPVSAVKLQPLAAGLLNGQPFSERRWASLLTASEFRTLRQAMRHKGLIEQVSERDPRQGYTLTQAGRELMTQLLPSPPPGREMA